MLRGMGTVMALPLLEAMSSSAKAAEEAAAARKRLQVIYTPNGMMMQNWTPAAGGRGLCLFADPQAAGALSQQVHGLHRPVPCPGRSPGRRRRRPWPLLRRLSDRHPCQEDRRRRHHRRRFDGPGRRQAVRRADPDPVAGSGPGASQPGGQLRQRLQLRLYQHPVLGERVHAAAGHHQSARSVRAAVRRRRQPGRQEPAGAAAPPGLDPGFRGPGRQAPVHQDGRHRQAQAGRISDLGARYRKAHPEGGAGRQPKPPRFPPMPVPPACRTASKTMRI